MDSRAIVQALALAQQEGHASVSLPWLSRQLQCSASVLMRELALLGDAVLGGQPGPGWVRLWQHGGHWRVALTPSGQAKCGQLPQLTPLGSPIAGVIGPGIAPGSACGHEPGRDRACPWVAGDGPGI